MTLRYVVADVFTDTALTGNQLAVFTDGRDVDEETMQKLAREMNFSEMFERADELQEVLGVRSSLPVELYHLGPSHVFVELGSEEQVAGLAPDFQALARFEAGINCFAGSGKRWKTRMFAPSDGVPEDP